MRDRDYGKVEPLPAPPLRAIPHSDGCGHALRLRAGEVLGVRRQPGEANVHLLQG